MYSRAAAAGAALLFSLALGAAHAQRTTYTGCHNRSESSGEVVEYCFFNGVETARTTYTVSGTATVPISVPASTTITTTTTTAAAAAQVTAVTDCHAHATEVLCVNGAGEEVKVDVTPTGEMPAQYTDCHEHGSEQYVISSARLYYYFLFVFSPLSHCADTHTHTLQILRRSRRRGSGNPCCGGDHHIVGIIVTLLYG